VRRLRQQTPPALPSVDRASSLAQMSLDPAVTNSQHYRVIFENERVRVLEYTDRPGDVTTLHEHPDSVMYTLSSFRRRLHHGGTERDVELQPGAAHWMPAQQHYGENIGETETHSIFVELKDGTSADQGSSLGPELGG